MKKTKGITQHCVTLGVLLGLVVPGGVWGSGVQIARMQDQASFLRGTLDGLSVDALGTLRLAPRAERLTALEDPFVLAAAQFQDGWVVGTGNDGRVIQVRRDGTFRTLFEVDEPEIFAVSVDKKGTVYAGSSPNGKVYRYQNGNVEALASLEQTYIWQIEPQANGDLLVATGTEGKLFRVARDGAFSVVWDSDDTHVRTILSRDEGTILAGTAGEGLIVEIAPGGGVRTLYDAPEPEVVALTAGAGRDVWVAVLASEASQLPEPTAEATATEGEADGETAVVIVEETGVQLVGSRPPGHKGPRSEILKISPAGSVTPVSRLEEDTVFTMRWSQGRLWVGTGLEGRLYTLQKTDLVLENDIDERQIVSLVGDEGDLPAFATSNASALYRLVAGKERQGTYISPVLDAGQMARFGTFHHRGKVPVGASLEFSFRSGSSAEPDASWTRWLLANSSSEIDLGELPSARFVQWRLTASARRESPTLASAELSYRQRNLAPRISKLEVSGPGAIQVPQNFSPSNQVFEPMHPNREGIFTTLKTSDIDNTQRYKSLWKYGYRTLRWTASDPNEDKLEYTLEVRKDVEAVRWLPIVKGLEATHHSFDMTGIPDGIYRFRLTVHDRSSSDGGGLVDQRQSEPVVVDHGRPQLAKIERAGETIRVAIADTWSPLRRAEYSVDAGDWKAVEVEDGLLDSRRETFVIPRAEANQMIVLRVMDAAFNNTTLDLGSED